MRRIALAKVAGLLVLVLLVGSNLILPAGAHVTRRLAHLAGHLDPRYINADEKASDANLLDGQDSTAFLGASAKAADADSLDGQDSTEFLGASAKAADADALDAIDSTGFVRGNGEVKHGARDIDAAGTHINAVLFGRINDDGPPNPNVMLVYECPLNAAGNGVLRFINNGTDTLNVFSDNGGDGPNAFQQVAPDGEFAQQAAATGEHITLLAQGDGMIHLEVFSRHSGTMCHAQSIAVISY
jgi:hypothetical protein